MRDDRLLTRRPSSSVAEFLLPGTPAPLCDEARCGGEIRDSDAPRRGRPHGSLPCRASSSSSSFLFSSHRRERPSVGSSVGTLVADRRVCRVSSLTEAARLGTTDECDVFGKGEPEEKGKERDGEEGWV